MSSHIRERVALEQEGVHIGGWSVRNLLRPSKANGDHESSEYGAQPAHRDWTPEEERALVRKLDLRVLLPSFIIYVLAYLDRGNIGSVKILQAGKPDSLEKSLHMKGTDFNWAVSATYFVMTAFILPSILMLKKTSAKVFFPTVMVCWGGIVMCMAAAKNTSGLIAARFFLGVPDSGVAPAIAFYFSFWYLPKERAFRLGVLFSANALGVASSGLLAIAIDNLNGKCGLKSWQWVFLIEGLMSIAMALPISFILLSFPETSGALSERERHIAINRFGAGSTRKTDVSWTTQGFVRVMTRPSTYIFFLTYVSLFIMISAQANFLPSILLAFLHYSPLKANLYAAAAALSAMPLFWLWPLHSDWTRERTWHFIIPLVASIPAYVVWTWSAGHPHQKTIKPLTSYGMSILAQLPAVAQPPLIAYRSSTLYGAGEQAVGLAAAFAALSIGSIIAPQMFPNSDAPFYRQAFIATCAIVAVAILSFLTLPFWLAREASARKRKTGQAMPLHAMIDNELSQAETSTQQIKDEIKINQVLADGDSKIASVERVDHLEHPVNVRV